MTDKKTYQLGESMYGIIMIAGWIMLVLVSSLITGVYSSLQPTHERRVNITHDYMYNNAVKICRPHGGFHYMVHITDIKSKRSGRYDGDDYPCSEITKVRCQDGTLLDFNTGISYCFISESQLKESLRND